MATGSYIAQQMRIKWDPNFQRKEWDKAKSGEQNHSIKYFKITLTLSFFVCTLL